MTMEEHCPHGSGNAVWCDECEREDKARSKRRPDFNCATEGVEV